MPRSRRTRSPLTESDSDSLVGGASLKPEISDIVKAIAEAKV